jgi:hypothetical protein
MPPPDLRGGRPPVLLRAVAIFDFLAGVGGSELFAGALRFEEDPFCAICAID